MKKYNFLDKDRKKINDHIDFSELRNKNILVTGATGLVGLYFLLSLSNIFEEYNISITIIHNRPIDKYLYRFIDFSKINCIQCDITDIDELDRYIGTKYDYIIHASGYGQPRKFLTDEIKTIEINTTVTHYLIKQLNRDGKFLFISSSEVYSGLTEIQTEDQIGTTTPLHPRACYIESKKGGETICNAYRRDGLDVKSARLSLTYGPGTRIGDSRMMSDFINKAINENEIKMLDSGQSIRSYLYITDSVIMMWNVLFNGKKEVYNISGSEVKKILDIAIEIASNFNVDVVVPDSNDNKMKGSPQFVNLSIDRYKTEFPDFPTVSVQEGIKKTIEWYKLININYE